MTHIIAIAGPSCAGKTELARRLSTSLNAPVLPLDAYYRELDHLSYEERCKFNFDTPAALDYELFREHVMALRRGQAIQKPVYDFTIHTRAPQTERIVPGTFAIIEGLFVLYWEDLRPLLSTKIYVEAPDPLCFARRSARDVRERGRTAESVYQQYEKTVRPMADLYVRPTRQFADVTVSGEQPLAMSAAAVLRVLKLQASHVPDAASV